MLMSVLDAVLVAALAIVAGLAVYALLRLREIRARYAPILDVEGEVERAKSELTRLANDREAFAAAEAKRRTDLATQYAEAKAVYDHLRSEVALLEENIEDMSFGLYRPHYSFTTSDQFRGKLNDVYDQKKEMIREGTAARCPVEWTVNNSKREGARMTKQNIKVMLRAFNGEVDAAVAKVTWNNVTRMEERIKRAFDAINASGTSSQISISPEYRDLALAELRLTHELEVKLHDEKEEQRQIRERIREEERAQREFEKAKADAEAEEARYQKALEKARAEVEKATGAELDKVNAKVGELEARLAEAHAKRQKATSMAQLTKSGNVYVISNLGSFGSEMMFKIGMTRRLDPMERIYELGDASVPFDFDVHAMIYSENAPGLENAFHREFAEKRVNLVNMRKEYFNVTLGEIEAFAKSQGVEVQFTKLAEAREYRETLAVHDAKKNGHGGPAASTGGAPLPESLFAEAAQRLG